MPPSRLVQARRRSGRSSSCRCRTRRRARRTRPPRSTNEMSCAATTVWRRPRCVGRQPCDLEQPRRRAQRRRRSTSRRLEPSAAASAAIRSSGRDGRARSDEQLGHLDRAAGIRCTQRGANAQPGGARPRPAATPGMPRSLRGTSGSGTAETRPQRVRVLRRVRAPRVRGPPRRCARRTSPRSGRRSRRRPRGRARRRGSPARPRRRSRRISRSSAPG